MLIRCSFCTQVAADFEFIAKAFALNTVCLYGGTQYASQEGILRRGCDIAIGTPGRVKDHLERGTLNLAKLKYVETGNCLCPSALTGSSMI